MIFDKKALAKIRIGELSVDRAQLVEMAITAPGRMYASQVRAIEEIFAEQNISFATTAEIEKAESDAVQERYDRILAGRDVRDLSAAEFDKASQVLTSRAIGRK